MKYWIEVFDRTVQVEVDEQGILVDGKSVEAQFDRELGSDRYGFSLNGRQFSITAQRHQGTWLVTHAGESAQVRVQSDRQRRLEAARGAGVRGRGSGAVRAPMPGLVLRVEVKPGVAVEAGTGLLVLEAMKMENLIRAPISGVVSRIDVGEGQAVEKGVLLVEITPDAS